MSGDNEKKVNVLMVGTGEYTTGYVGGGRADSDKGAGVVALTMFDLRRRGKVDHISMCGVNGKKFPGIREHMKRNIEQVYNDMDLTCKTFPGDDQVNPKSYVDAIAAGKPGDIAVIFTPDDTHFDIALECINKGMHVMVTKPIVQTLEHHTALAKAAKKKCPRGCGSTQTS
jgi:D-galacturonate reductase